MSKKSPQLRFEGFTDDWEERKLGDITKISTGKLDANAMVENGKYDFYTSGIKKYRIDVAAFEGPSITIAGNGATVGYMHLADNKFNAYQRTYVLQEFLVDRSFIFSEIGNKLPKKIKQEARTGNIPYIVMDMLTELKVSIPQNNTEQKKIGDFFKQLDDTIALHQRKLDLLKETKKGFLQKMFPKNGAKVPEIRFPGFTGDWEDRKLSSIAERVTRKNKNNESTLPLTISAQDGLVDQNDYFNKQVASRDVTGYFLVKNGEFAYNKSYSNGYPWGAIKRLDKYEMGVLSTLYIVFKPTAINSQFLVSYYETTRWYREVSKNAAEGARNHGLLNISPNDFFNTLLTIPKSAEEQQQIGSFFKQLDDTIALHQRKLDLLKEQKKGFLQKMFV
ncbi:restriction endonuclease subunit S [Lactococcus petauri]|uniref:restriction endonuclease subunit S n=1 Tax=Lactococcus petauri TaxID=1940789 RepID=UPI003A4E401C